MQCRFCGVTIDPLVWLSLGSFCSDDHRQLYEFAEKVLLRLSQGQPLEALFPLTAWARGKSRPAPPKGLGIAPLSLDPKKFGATSEPPVWPSDPGRIAFVSGIPESHKLLPLKFQIAAARGPKPGQCQFEPPETMLATPLLPRHEVDPLAGRRLGEWPDGVTEAPEAKPPADKSSRAARVSFGRLGEVWRNAPGDLKLLTTLLPVLLVLALVRTIPKVSAHPSPSVKASPGLVQMVSDKWKTLRGGIMKRAGVEYVDDFRSGLDDWQGRTNLTARWSYDAAGFVRPGPLALYRPTLDLTDYRFEFLGEIDQRALGFVYRAADLDNYYVVKLVVVKPGPLPVIEMVRYPVIHGKEGPKKVKPLPFATRTDMLYRIRLEAHGEDFVMLAQDQVVDAWSDGALKKGGVGFFCGRGEQARIRWVEVTHQYDRLGRLCAYLTPGGPE